MDTLTFPLTAACAVHALHGVVGASCAGAGLGVPSSFLLFDVASIRIRAGR